MKPKKNLFFKNISHFPYSESCDALDAHPDSTSSKWEAFYASLDPTTQAVVDAYEASLTDTIGQECSLVYRLEKKFRSFSDEILKLLDVESPRVDDREFMNLAPGVQDSIDELLNLDKRFKDLWALRAKRRCLTLTIKAMLVEGQLLLDEPANAENLSEWRMLRMALKTSLRETDHIQL